MKKMLALLLAVPLLLAACAGDPGDTMPSTENTVEPSSAESTPPTEESTPPTEESTPPTEESTVPTEESTAPTEESTVPTEESTVPTEESTVPTEESTEPTAGDTETARNGWISQYRYDDNKLLYDGFYENDVLKQQIVYENGKPIWRSTLTYGEDGQLSSYDSEILHEDGTVLKKIHHEGGSFWEDFVRGGVERWYCTYTYDENGAVIDEVYEYPAEDTKVVYRKFYAYDENGRLTGIFSASDGENYDASYDEQGRIVFESDILCQLYSRRYYEYHDNGGYTTHFFGKTSGVYYFHYDENGRLLERYGGDDMVGNPPPNIIHEWDIYAYNEYGDVVSRENRRYGELRYTYGYEYKYDDNGNWTEQICYRDGEKFSYTSRVFDEVGRLIEEYNEGEGRGTYTYDQEGNLIEKVYQWDNGTVDLYTYTYDENGRLLEEVNVRND